jgi:hypothetical protein
MTERQRWGFLVLSLIVAFGGGLGLAYVLIDHNEREAQRDLCALLAVLINPNAPPPETPRQRAIADALRAYRAKRC